MDPNPTKKWRIQSLVNACLIRPSPGEVSSPILFVQNADGSLRLCIDYPGMNEVTRKDDYPFPRVDDTLDDLNEANLYTYLDLASRCCKFESRRNMLPRQHFKLSMG
jgi:hypothetical protein